MAKYKQCKKHSANNDESNKLIDMLQSGDFVEIEKALDAIGQLKIRIALPYLKNMALYDEDIGIQQAAIRTIRKIGGKQALDILKFLKTTENKDFIEEVLCHGVD